MENSDNYSGSVVTQKASTPPPVPLRTRSKQQNLSISNLSQSSLSSSPNEAKNMQQLAVASSVAAQLVQRTAMTGSIHSLDVNAHISMQPNTSSFIHSSFMNGSTGTPVAGSVTATRPYMHNSRRSSSYDDCDRPTNDGTQSANHTNEANLAPFDLLNGEEIIDADDFNSEIVYVTPDNKSIRGRLYVTNFRLFFKSDEPQISYVIDMPLGVINRIEKIGHQSSKQQNSYGIVISCKDNRRMRFANAQEKRSRKQIFDILQKYAFPLSNQISFFSYSFKQTYGDNSGWSIYNAEAEYRRMGIHGQGDWRITNINSNYKFCDTYPKILVVPAKITDDDLREVAEFRSKRRLPVLAWISRDKNTNDAAILRSSQPCCGLAGKQSRKDKEYLHSVLQINLKSVSGKLSIMDARPQVNAMANRTKGGGYENEETYEDCEVNFLNIQNIHVMRESLRKVFDLASPQSDDKNYFLNLENTRWLEHTKCILSGATRIVNKVHHGATSVLVHCSDGWDRTAQLTSLSMLMLDKFYRTLKGFQVLIEKEWLSFGHRFALRMGHGVDKHSDQDRSPIFVQFIDCVWQIQQQNEKMFEFNENFLLTILKHVFTCQYGTFLYNSEYEREKYDLKNKTVSFWSYINSNEIEFKNSSYVEYDGVIVFNASLRSLFLWTNYYFQYKDMSFTSDTEQVTSSSMTASGRNFLSQMISQMKTTMFNATPEPELIRYRNTLQQEINVDH